MPKRFCVYVNKEDQKINKDGLDKLNAQSQYNIDVDRHLGEREGLLQSISGAMLTARYLMCQREREQTSLSARYHNRLFIDCSEKTIC